MNTMEDLMDQFPRAGSVEWIGIRPARKAPLVVVDRVEATAGKGLAGDHAMEKTHSKRQVTLIMAEHLAATASGLGVPAIDPGSTRRNIVVRGINLLALKGRRFKVGDATLELTDECHPCSRMETNLGLGGYNAMRGHGGWCAIVVEGGLIRTGDAVRAEPKGDAMKADSKG